MCQQDLCTEQQLSRQVYGENCVSVLGEQPKRLPNVMVKMSPSTTVERSCEFPFFPRVLKNHQHHNCSSASQGNYEGLKTVRNGTRQNLHPLNLMLSVQMGSCSYSPHYCSAQKHSWLTSFFCHLNSKIVSAFHYRNTCCD